MGTTSNNWSFSFYEESYDETYQSESEEDTKNYSKTSILPEENAEAVPGNSKELPKSVYNPFLLTKMNYFRRKSSRIKLRVFDKRVVIPRSKIIQSIHQKTKKDTDVLVWQSTIHLNARKGCPTEQLISTFATMVGCKSNEITLVKEGDKSWYTIGV